MRTTSRCACCSATARGFPTGTATDYTLLGLIIQRLAVTKGRLDPDTANYLACKQADGKSRREALRCLKRHLARRVWRLLQPAAAEHSPSSSPRPPTLAPAGITIHCNAPHSRFSLT
jgi:hypothetical protein